MHTQKYVLLTLLSLTLIVSGCATVTPWTYPNPNTLSGVTDAIQAREIEYSNAYSKVAKGDDYYAASVIAVATAAIAISIFTHNPTAKLNWLQGIGIGAGAGTLGWNYANASGKEEAYLLGIRQLGCLHERAVYFGVLVDVTKTVDDPLVPASSTLRQSVSAAQKLIATNIGAALQPDEAAALSALGQAVTAGTAALDAATAELAIRKAPADSLLAIYEKIDSQVYKAAQGKAISLADALAQITSIKSSLTSINAPAQTPKAAAPAAAAPTTRPSLTDAANQLTAAIASSVNIISANSQFTAAKAQASACALAT